MRHPLLKCLLALAVLLGPSVASLRAQRLHGAPAFPDTIPFIPSPSNNVLVPVVINGSDSLLLMFHSTVTGVFVTADALARTRSLRVGDTTNVQSWGGSQRTGYSGGNTLRIGGLAWDGVGITIDEQSGAGSDGKFGYDLFADGVLEIDHDHRRLVVHRALPKDLGGYTAVPLAMREGSLYVEASVALQDSAYMDRFLFHTGYGGTCILGTGFMSRLGDHVALDTLGVKELTDSFGHVLKNVVARTPALAFGGSVFTDVRINVMDRRSNFTASVLGNDLLRRFNVLFDFRNERLYVRPDRSVDEPFSSSY